MTSCESCGKLIASGTGETLCRACREAARAAAQSPDAGPPVEKVQDAAAVAITPFDDSMCVRCRRHPTLVDTDFCLGCYLELVASLGDAAEEVFREPPVPPEPPVASVTSLMSDIEAKRERTATSHLDVVGGVKIK